MGYTRISQIAEGKNIPALNEDEKVVKSLATGGGGDSLPVVTEADNGDVLTVVDGAWDKAALSGGEGLYIIELTTQPTSSYADLPSGVTYSNILAALSEGKLPILHIKTGTSSGNGVHYWIPLSDATPYSNTMAFAQWSLIASQGGTTGVKYNRYVIASTNKIKVDSYNINFAS